MSWKWERREERKTAKKKQMPMHGKGMKRLLNDMEYREKYETVQVGMRFVDEDKNRELQVYSQCERDPDFWMCEVCNHPTEVLYRYKASFILKNKRG